MQTPSTLQVSLEQQTRSNKTTCSELQVWFPVRVVLPCFASCFRRSWDVSQAISGYIIRYHF
jgi:hypothetical protein